MPMKTGLGQASPVGVYKNRGQKGLSGNFQAGLGKQLSSRVSSGAIDQQQELKEDRARALERAKLLLNGGTMAP